VSLFFLDGFLGLEHVYDTKERTSRLYKTLHRTFDDVKDELSEAQYARLEQYLNGQVVGGRVTSTRSSTTCPRGNRSSSSLPMRLTQNFPTRSSIRITRRLRSS
jgi:hypothetical protein